MPDIDLKAATPDTSLPTTGFLFGADSQAAASPSVYSTQTVATTLLGSTSLTGATITTSQPVLDMSQTWNASGVTFTGLKFNATDTASAAASLLMDLQIGGAGRFRVDKLGGIISRDAIQAVSGGSIGFSNSNTLGAGSQDVFLTRKAASNLRLGAADTTGTTAPTAQTLSVQSWASSTNNNQPGADFKIDGSQGTGTGAGGSIIFRVAPAGAVANGVQNALATALTIGSNRNATVSNVFADFAGNILLGSTSSVDGIWLGASTVSSPSSTNYTLSVNSTNTILNANTGAVRLRVGNTDYITCTSNSVSMAFSTAVNGSVISRTDASTSYLGLGASDDIRLYRDTAATLALRNGTNAQTFNVYNTFTSSTNFERFRIVAQSAAAVLIGTEKGSGGGTARALELQTDATTRLTIGSGGGFTIADAQDIAVGSTTGTKIGTATTQKIGFFNAAPVVQPTAVADATDNATAITQLNALLSRMRNLGLIAT